MNPYLSATVILSNLFEVIGHPWRIVDVGCGDGGFLLAAHEIEPQAALLGIDLNPEASVPEATREALSGTSHTLLATDPFTTMDLRTPPPLSEKSPWRKSDLVICVEVAEHLPPTSAEVLVDLVASLAGGRQAAVLWSAALPGQGPYPPEGWSPANWNPSWHWNEQPSEYWENLFIERGFLVQRDATEKLREAARSSPDVDPWYKHLTLLAHGVGGIL